MCRLVHLILCLFLVGSVAAQQPAMSSDSLYHYAQGRRELAAAHSSLTNLLFSGIRQVAKAELYTGTQQGSYRRAAEPFKNTYAGFHTEGIRSQGRFLLSGSFDFEKQWQDSLAWSHQAVFDEAQPYYFLAGKAGEYEGQLYRLRGAAAYNVWKERLYIGTGITYQYNWLTRSVDPRPDVKHLFASLQPEISYRFGNQVAGLAFYWGQGSETNQIAYKNRNYEGNQLYMERNNFLSLGFGYIGKMGRYMQRYDDRSGLSASYGLRLDKWTVNARGGYELWQQDISLETEATRQQHDLYAFLQQDKTYGNLLVTRHGAGRQQWELNFSTRSLLNWASEFGATSYQYTGTEASFAYRYLWRPKEKSALELGGGLSFKDTYKEDWVAAHTHQLTIVQPHLEASYYRQGTKGSRFSATLMPSLRVAVDNSMAVPATQESYFTRGVVYTDYLYWQPNAWRVDASFSYQFASGQLRKRLGLSVDLSWQQALEAGRADIPALYIPHGNRLGATAMLQLYL